MSPEPSPAASPPGPGPPEPVRRFRLPVAAVLLITFFAARANTLDLLRDRADLGL